MAATLVFLLAALIVVSVFHCLFVNPCNAEATFEPKHKDANIFENHLNTVMLVFMGNLSLSTLR